MERPIGDKFTDCCIDYVVEEVHDNNQCNLCAFGVLEVDGANQWITCTAKSVTGECGECTRSDGKDVYFRRVE